MQVDRNNIAALLLAGGKGRRIGGGKPARRLAGRPLLGHVRAFAEAHCDALFLSVRDQAPETDVDLVQDAPGLVGPMAGIIAGLKAAEQAGFAFLLVLPCDTPFLPDDLVERFAGALAANRASGIVVASSGGRLHPTIALVRVECRTEAEAVAAAEERRLMALFEKLNGVRLEWLIEEAPNGLLDPFFNVNSADDLATAEVLYPIYAARQKSSD